MVNLSILLGFGCIVEPVYPPLELYNTLGAANLWEGCTYLYSIHDHSYL